MPLLVALIAKEFQTWLRGRLTFALLSGLVLLTSALFFLMALVILAPDANAAPALFSTTATTGINLLVSYRALFLFAAVSACMLLASAVVAPAVAASAFAAERERGTLDLLLLQSPGPGSVVTGKVLAALLFSLMLLFLGLPLFAPAWSFGGVEPRHVLALAAVLVTSTLLLTSVGVFVGALVRGALPAALLAQGVAFFLLFGTVGLHLAASHLSGSSAFKPLLWMNPLLALLSGGGSTTESLARFAPAPLRGVLALPPFTAMSGTPVPAWVVSSAVWLLLSFALVVAAAVVIDPCHPLKSRARPTR